MGASWGAPRTTALLARADQALERSTGSSRCWNDLGAVPALIAGERSSSSASTPGSSGAAQGCGPREASLDRRRSTGARTGWKSTCAASRSGCPGARGGEQGAQREVAQPKDLLALLAASQTRSGKASRSGSSRARTARRSWRGRGTTGSRTTSCALLRPRRPHPAPRGEARDRRALDVREPAGVGDGVLRHPQRAPPPPRFDHGLPRRSGELRQAAGAAILIASPRVARSGRLPACAPSPCRGASRVRQGRLPPLRKSAGADDVASLLFTQRHHRKPKGVLLTHRTSPRWRRSWRASSISASAKGPQRPAPAHTFSSAVALVPCCSERRAPTGRLTAERWTEALNTGRIHP